MRAKTRMLLCAALAVTAAGTTQAGSLTTLDSEAAFVNWTTAGGTPKVIMFGRDSCPNCTTVEPVLESLADTYAGRADFAEMDVDAYGHLMYQYLDSGSVTLPVVLVFCPDGSAQSLTGLNSSADYAALIDGCSASGGTDVSVSLSAASASLTTGDTLSVTVSVSGAPPTGADLHVAVMIDGQLLFLPTMSSVPGTPFSADVGAGGPWTALTIPIDAALRASLADAEIVFLAAVLEDDFSLVGSVASLSIDVY